MEQLAALMSRALHVSHKETGSVFDIRYDGETRSVYSMEHIPRDTCIGFLEGSPMYIWDISHSEYIFVEEDLVLDMSEVSPRSILSFMHCEDETDNEANCVVVVDHNHVTCETRFFVKTICDIYPGHEVVYSVDGRY